MALSTNINASMQFFPFKILFESRPAMHLTGNEVMKIQSQAAITARTTIKHRRTSQVEMNYNARGLAT